jgi:hypothetical protein
LATGILQLKPREESFYRILFEKLMKIDITVLGEGQSDVEVSKAVFNKLIGASNRFVIGFTDCEGFRNVEYMAKVIARLVGLLRKLKGMIIIVDADEYTTEARVKGIVDSLKSIGIVIEDVKTHSEQVFETEIHSNDRILKLIIAVNGDFTISTRKHALEDHCIKLMKIPIQSNIDSTKQVVKDITECVKSIDTMPEDLVKNTFKHLYTAFQLLLKL